ncbi:MULTISPECIES: aminotransferase class IV [unclassified Legionella]|uniref:aminotransferase class IV n=1 Tax=unclassified Legionella TaxID=2622702 RepID=UPI0010545A5C|nr:MULTISPECIES: aminotransferase class IV [unclassified Legionella]MDI9817871.1 aminotransferase class IV [Legionella sp. PL877]
MTELIFANENGRAPFFADDRIFLGEGLFETLRVIHGKPCYPQLHWQRLQQAAFSLGIPFTLSFESWLNNLLHCIKLAALQDGGIKVILGGGDAPRGLTERSQESCLIFNAFHYDNDSRALKLLGAPWLRDSQNPVYQIKSINYLEAIIARRYAEGMGADDVLFFNFARHATETSVANLFVIKDDQLHTPPLNSGLLAGIIRHRILALCQESGIVCKESELDRNELLQADAMFLCNALQGIRKVYSFENTLFATSHPLIILLQELLARDKAIN